MAVEEQEVNRPLPDLSKHFVPFVEVICKGSEKPRRFAGGTEAGFAVSLINRKVDGGPHALYIEAVKEGEEPVSFGPNSVLVDYGDGWKLQTVTEADGFRQEGLNRPATSRIPSVTGINGSNPGAEGASQTVISYLYIGKILLAFVLIFVMGAVLTLALENLPRLILFINSSM